MKIKKRWILLFAVVVSMGLCSIPEVVHNNSGISESTGSARKGKLVNAWLMPYRGPNFHYFSPVSYYLLNNAYVNSSVHAALIDAYKTCEATCPGKDFIYMECTRRRGGRMLFHWTHQNGMSVDFMVPKKKGNDSDVWANNVGLFHYLLKFNEDGKFSLNRKTEIDFETISNHIIALDDAAKKNGLSIRKILFHTSLHDELFNTEAGQELVKREINITPRLRDLINRFHDDHYHVDFEFVRSE